MKSLYSKTKLLLTGSDGFIGKYFVDNYKNKYNIKTFSFLKDNFESLDLIGVDAIIHLSALVHQMSGAKKEDYERVNVEQTLKLATKAKNRGVKHFIFISTVAVYKEGQHVLKEQSLSNPATLYGKSKLKAEQSISVLSDKNFIISIIRPSMVYGYNAPGNIKSLIRLIKKVPLLPFGGIENERNFVYVGNLCHMIDEVVRQRKSGIFLASDEEALSTTKLIQMLANAMNRKIFLINIPFFATILKLFKPSLYQRLFQSLKIDNSWSKEELNLKNPYTLQQGIEKIFKDLK